MMIDRSPLLKNMSLGFSCEQCIGECCTSKSNSMQITQQEAQDIFDDLTERNLLTPPLRMKIDQTIKEYRLDVEIPSFGARSNIRRTYTCPFYSPGPKGCLISPDKKPLGCLAFNPSQADARGLSSGCRSDQKSLMEITPEGDKLPIPVALARLI